MTEVEETQFILFLKAEAELYPQAAAMTDERAAGYIESLGEFSLEELGRVFRALRLRCKFFPTIQEVAEACGRSPVDQGEVAWRTLCAAADEGQMPSVHAYDSAMAYAIQAFDGWAGTVAAIADASPEMRAHAERAFKAAYRLACNGAAVPARQYFVGEVEADNRANISRVAEWADRKDADRLPLKVLIITTREYRMLELPFNPRTMGLLPEAAAALRQGGAALRAFQPAPFEPAGLLPAVTGEGREPATPADIAAIREAIAGLAGSRQMERGQ